MTKYSFYFVETHLNNNHTLIESKNILMAGIVFQKFPSSRKWIKKGMNILDSCLSKQIDDDGIHIERSSMYQKVILSELIELDHVINSCNHLIKNNLKNTKR